MLQINLWDFFVHHHIIDPTYDADYTFSAYYYPSYIAGMSYGWNGYGLAFSENEVGPVTVNMQGIGDTFVCRAAYSASSMDEAVRFATMEGANGVSLNMGTTDVNDPWRVVNLETAGAEYNLRVIQGNYAHANMYRHLNISQYSDPSSIARIERIYQLLGEVSTPESIGMVLGDTKNPDYPVYRNGTSPDCCATLSSAIFDLDSGRVEVFTSNPKTTAPWKVFWLHV